MGRYGKAWTVVSSGTFIKVASNEVEEESESLATYDRYYEWRRSSRVYDTQ